MTSSTHTAGVRLPSLPIAGFLRPALAALAAAAVLAPPLAGAQNSGPPPAGAKTPTAAQTPPAAQTQGPPPVARGVIVAVNDDSVTLKSDDGKTTTYGLLKMWDVTVLKPVDVSSIQPGSFIGTAEMPQKNGSGRSLEVHVFPPGVKAGEGHYGWDVKKGSMMTNGTVGKVTSTPKGRELEVSYPNGERKIVVPPNVPIVQLTKGERSMIKPGIPAFLILIGKTPDGKPAAPGITIGENGARPPM